MSEVLNCDPNVAQILSLHCKKAFMASAYIQIIRILTQEDNYENVGNPCSLSFMYKSLLEPIVLKFEKSHHKENLLI